MPNPNKQLQDLRDFALNLPGTEEGVSCAGTAIETRTVQVGNKAFLFLGAKQVRLKLVQSLPEANLLASAEPKRYKVGANGWITINYNPEQLPETALLQKWASESFQSFASKRLPQPGRKVKPY